ncbi:MAG: potassium channel family protein [Candidatus Auribacterota bacterium]
MFSKIRKICGEVRNKWTSTDIKEFSRVLWVLEIIFFVLQYFCVSTWICGTREEHNANYTLARSQRRSLKVEKYLLCFFVLEVASIFVINLPSNKLLQILQTIFLWIVIYRILTIFIVIINMNIFDILRLKGLKHRMISSIRTVVLSFWNYLELMLCFGICYDYFSNNGLSKQLKFLDPYYFSVITQLTIGYGDIHPVRNWVKILVIFQGILGFIFAVFIIARIVSFLPRIGSLYEDNNKLTVKKDGKE